MNLIDWLVVAAACSLVFVVGLTFARRSSKKGAEGYFAGDRDVPWWAIGLSNSATYSGALTYRGAKPGPQVQLTTIDELVRELKLDQVDYIKMVSAAPASAARSAPSMSILM